MAKDKKSFLMYCDWMELFEDLPDSMAGKLIKHIFKYTNDLDPKTDDLVLKASFVLIKQALKRDLKNWESKVKVRAEAGRLGGIAKASNAKQKLANLPDSVTVTVSDSVTDNVTVTDKEKKETIGEEKKSSLHSSLKEIFLQFYKKKTDEQYYWAAKDGAALKQLILKTKKKCREKEIKDTDEKVIESVEVLLSRIKDKWMLDNLSMTIINSKFNEIVQNGQVGKERGSRVTEKTIDDFLAGDN